MANPFAKRRLTETWRTSPGDHILTASIGELQR
ncbi:hypothetical protein L195_g063215, partial [Trifolium pratense]